MISVETAGASVDAAIEEALRQLGVPRDQVEIEILTHSSKGLFGLGGRKARVRATVRRPPPAPAADVPRTPPAGDAAGPAAVQRPAPAGSAADHACAVLRNIVRHIGVDAEVRVRTEADQVVLELSGDSAGILIGRRGQMLDALEYILNRIVAREDERAPRIVVDSQQYRARRRAALEDLARRMGEEAKRTRKPVTLNPMSPQDRRTIHLLLQEEPTLSSKGVGRGYYRRLVIVPEAPQGPSRSR